LLAAHRKQFANNNRAEWELLRRERRGAARRRVAPRRTTPLRLRLQLLLLLACSAVPFSCGTAESFRV